MTAPTALMHEGCGAAHITVGGADNDLRNAVSIASLGTSFSIRLALPFRIVPFALHSVTSMAVRPPLGGALDTVASTSTSLSPSPSPPASVPRFASSVASPLFPRAPPSPSLLGPLAMAPAQVRGPSDSSVGCKRASPSGFKPNRV